MVLSEEWRPVPGFHAYEISESGRVRQRYDLTQVKVTGNSVMLQRGGKRFHRSIDKLLRESFEVRQNPVLAVEGFRAIPDFPGYSINRNGDVFNEKSRRFLEHRGEVQLLVDGKRYHKTVASLIKRTF